MTPTLRTLEHDHICLAYRVWGTGTHPMLAFHGFGQTGAHFAALQPAWEHTFRVYAFDLFCHGDSAWPHGTMPLNFATWTTLMQRFCQQEKIDMFSAAGFSLGSRLALATATAFPQQLTSLTLVAPDSPFLSPWYRLAMAWPRLFRWSLSHSDVWLSWITRLEQTGVLAPAAARLALRSLRQPAHRARMACAWPVFSALRFSPVSLSQLFERHAVSVQLFLGKNDPIAAERKLIAWVGPMTRGKVTLLDVPHERLLAVVAGHWPQN
ncbi:alpha/beta fold hydrolase [Catalinimonas alkaloidigena]|uniref:alpha/beta fold hydrolase n=1 Tax=Catalinimonas alkaloidigena TaxID=1075417 RepID=UPI0015A1F47C|nr:alpha/beta hydrolase [Catalinimonas alkaloidigena]